MLQLQLLFLGGKVVVSCHYSGWSSVPFMQQSHFLHSVNAESHTSCLVEPGTGWTVSDWAFSRWSESAFWIPTCITDRAEQIKIEINQIKTYNKLKVLVPLWKRRQYRSKHDRRSTFLNSPQHNCPRLENQAPWFLTQRLVSPDSRHLVTFLCKNRGLRFFCRIVSLEKGWSVRIACGKRDEVHTGTHDRNGFDNGQPPCSR